MGSIPMGAVTCYAVGGGKITDPTFNVRVPVLGMSVSSKGGVTSSDFIVAKNATDYRVSHDGDIKMGSTKYKITKSSLEADPPGVPQHGHESIEPFEGKEVHYSKLNDVDYSDGDMMLGIFLDGDTRNLVIWHIPHKVPIGGAVQYD